MNSYNKPHIDKNLRQLFTYWDTDCSGYLCQKELRELCSQFGITASESDDIFTDLDRDGDGKISYEDFQSGFDDYEKGIMSSSIASTSFKNAESYENIKKALEMEDIKERYADKKHFSKKLNFNKPTLKSTLSGSSEHYVSEGVESPDWANANTQSVIQELLDSVRNLQEENKKLVTSWMREKKEHEKHIQQLEEDVDSQVKDVETRVKLKAKEEVEAERHSLREMMKGEMEELQNHLTMFEKVESWLKHNQNNPSDGKVDEIREKLENSVSESKYLRLSLMDTQTNVALMRSELAQLRAHYDEKCSELSHERERSIMSTQEHEHLSRQLYLLQDANKRLQDTNDSLRTIIDTSPKNVPQSASILNTPSNSHYKRGSLIGDYIKQDFNPSVNGNAFSRLSEVDLESLSTIDDEVASISHQSFASCPASAGRLYKLNDDENDSGLSILTRDDEIFQSTSRSLQCSPVLKSLQKKTSSLYAQFKNDTAVDDQKIRQNPYFLSETQQAIITESNGPPERTYKVIFIGDASVGKSTFILRLTKGVFNSKLSTTLGVDFQVRTFNIEGRNVALQLWDTAGQERYRSITKNYFRKADGIMLLYDVTSEQSFLNVRNWINAVEEVTSKGVPVIIVGNKTDLRPTLQAQECSVVKAEDGFKVSQQFGVMFAETSCKDGNNILEVIAQLTRIMTQNEDNLIKSAGLQLSTEKARRFPCCGK